MIIPMDDDTGVCTLTEIGQIGRSSSQKSTTVLEYCSCESLTYNSKSEISGFSDSNNMSHL